MKPKIISIGYAVPEKSYTQREIFDQLRYPKHFWRVFRDAQIEKRHFVLPVETLKKLTFQEQQEQYEKSAFSLSKEALLNTLDGRNPCDLGLITFSTCTGFPPGPTIPHYLARDLGLSSDIQIDNRSSQGCEAAHPGLRRAYDSTALTGRPSVAISCELCSLTYYPEPEGKPDPENHWELLRSNAIFADGCSCTIVGFDDDPRHPEIIDFSSYIDTKYLSELGYVWQNGRLRVKLSQRVPNIAAELVTKATGTLLRRNNLSVDDIQFWAIHPPGAIVLDRFRDGLGFAEEKLVYSREALRLFGNCSSSTVGIVGKLLIKWEKKPKGYLVMVTVGPGMVANTALMRFGE